MNPLRRCVGSLWVTLTCLLGCAHAPATPVAPDLFEFHSNPWVNLHHVLYAAGRGMHGLPLVSGGGAGQVSGLENVEPAALTPAERAIWDAAVAHYVVHVARGDLAEDGHLEDIKNKLSFVESTAQKIPYAVPPELAAHLEKVMPIYRARWWPHHDRANLAWVEKVQPLLAQHGPDVARHLSRVFNQPWPNQPFRVDVGCYAGWAGAYSTLNPVTHVVVSSVDARNAGLEGFETLFHEASHGLVRPVRDVLSRELEVQGKTAGALWHAVLFYSAGAAVKQKVPAHRPYADQHGVYDSNPWKVWRPLMETHWAPYVEGRTTLEAAVHNLVGAL